MIKKPATIRDVASASGVSQATVSYVLNDGPRRVDPATRKRILAAIDHLQYHPSSVARGLSRKRMDCIGVVFPQPDQRLVVDSYFSSILDGIIEVATNRKQNVTLYTGIEWQGRQSLPAFRDRRVDGLILIAALTDSDIVPALADAGIDFVLVNDMPHDPRVASVDIDNIEAVRKVIEHLRGLGHRRIAFLSGEANSPSTPPRRRGYFEAMAQFGLPIDNEIVIEGFYGRGWGREAMGQLLALPNPPTAVFAGGDGIALGAYDACAAAGVSIPEQISIVGFDDAPFARDSHPPMTTVRHPLQEIGIMAATLLMERIHGKHDETELAAKVILPTELIVRGSTGPAHPSCLPAIQHSDSWEAKVDTGRTQFR